ncbi:hypothetical protein NPIL_36421 [Nephila pilipes]|uniref:Uncharacterized protein n=1 Tax=Nephila pilipes TaxID=299642 RepID=A0A8X6TNV8_NEPPI|nr:hypothetical protein NPIL_36421 [Nephila pilipes]
MGLRPAPPVPPPPIVQVMGRLLLGKYGAMNGLALNMDAKMICFTFNGFLEHMFENDRLRTGRNYGLFMVVGEYVIFKSGQDNESSDRDPSEDPRRIIAAVRALP